MKSMKYGKPRERTGRYRFGVVMAVGLLLGAFGLAACQPTPAQTALKLTLTDSASSNAPAANVTVAVFPAADSSAPATANGITDANGNVWFTHSQLPAGDYLVRFGSSPGLDRYGHSVDYSSWYDGSASGTAGGRSGAATVTVSGATPTDLTASYAVPRGGISSFVQNADGSAFIPGATATAYAVPSGTAVDSVTTGAHVSSFYFEGSHSLPAQQYRIGISKAGYATIYLGRSDQVAYSLADAPTVTATIGSLNVVDGNGYVHLQPESTITGTVKPDGTNAMGGVIVAAYVASTNHRAATTTTAADGTFTLHGLSGTEYRLAFITPGNTYAPMMLGGGTGPGASFDVANGSAFSLQTGGTLSVGTVSLTVGTDCAAAQAGGTTLMNGAHLHNCDLATADLTNIDLKSANLSGADLSAATLPDPGVGFSLLSANLSDANLSDATGSNALLSGADLSGADLSHADMAYANLSDATLTGANLSHTDLSHGGIDGSNVSGADLSSTTFLFTQTFDLSWTTPPTIPAGYKLVGTNLVGAGTLLVGVDLSGADLSGMDLSHAKFQSTDFTGANLSNSDLSSTRWAIVNLSDANLSGADLTGQVSVQLTSDANTVLPTGWSIVGGSFHQN